MKRKESNLKVRRNFIAICVIACIVGITVVTAMIAIKKNADTKVANLSAMDGNENGEVISAEDAEAKLNEGTNAKALTIQARTPNTDNFTYVTSGDGHQVPVPKGYVASPTEDERYRDGKYVTWKKQEDLTFKSPTTYYLDQTLTFASPAGETYAWTENATVGAWQSGNYQVASSTSTIETNEFTVTNNGDVVRIVWSVSSQNTANTDYAYYTITNTATSATIGGTSTAIYGTGNGTSEASLIFNNADVALDAGTYKVTVAYKKNASTNTNLDRAYVKSINVYSTIASSSNTSIEVNGSYDYAWTYDSTISAWKSGNYNISNSTSTIESNTFTVAEVAKVRISWAVCSDETYDYVYYTITNTATSATTGGVSTAKSGKYNGTLDTSLTYTNTDVSLEAGTYKVTAAYTKDASTNTNLDRAYLKSISVYTESATGDDGTFRVGSGGFVIYEKNVGETDEQARQGIEEDLDTAQKTRNQYVWLPISTSEIENMYWLDSGKIVAKKYSYGEQYEKWRRSEKNQKEPGVTDSNQRKTDFDNIHLKRYLEGISRNEFNQEMREEFNEMITSVKTYGGFYVGRYETGNINSKIPVVRKGNSNVNNVNWYSMYKRCKNLKRANKAVQTGLIWGIQWDEIANWLIDSGEKSIYEVIRNSDNWGNYRDVTFEYTDAQGIVQTKRLSWRTKIPTGSAEYTKANNIYDLAGNYAEFTMRLDYNGGRREIRGGDASITSQGITYGGYSSYDSNYNLHDTYPDEICDAWGSRSTLFINL